MPSRNISRLRWPIFCAHALRDRERLASLVALLIVIASLAVPIAVNAEKSATPTLEGFIKNLVESIRPDGRVDFSAFSCGPEDLSRIRQCRDLSSSVGFRAKAEEFVEVIYVPIFLTNDQETGGEDALTGHLSIRYLSELRAIEEQFSLLPSSPVLQGIPPCRIAMDLESGEPENAFSFGLQNPEGRTRMVFLFAGYNYEYLARNLREAAESNLPVSSIVIVNDLENTCVGTS